jgi:Ca2+-binding RTX toxin-like protein
VFAPTGQTESADFLVPANLDDQPRLITVEALAGGGAMAIWELQTASTRTVLAQRLDDAGQPVGAKLTLLSGGTNLFWSLDALQLDNGNLLLVWRENTASGLIQGQVYGLDGTAVGSELALGSANTGAGVAPLSGGRFLLVWGEHDSVTLGDIKARIFNADGTAAADSFTVNSSLAGAQGSISIATFADGRFVAVWVSSLNGRQDVIGQIFDAQGGKIGGEFLVNIPDNTYNDYPAVAVLEDQTFVVAWQRPSYFTNNFGQTVNNGYGITAQVFSSTGTKIGGQFWIDDTNANRYSGPSIEALGNGGYIITWYDEKVGINDPDQTGLKGRIFGPNSPPELVSANSASVVENTTAVLTLQGIDPDINARLTYSISGGADAGYFSINAQTGALRFINPPDFEGTAFHPNTYVVQVSVSDGHASSSQTLTITVTDAREAVNLTGTAGADVLIGTEFADGLSGLGGNDTLIGGEQDDYLDGGEGTDLLYGGPGHDTYVVNGGDLVFEGENEGNLDRVFADTSFYLFDNIEMLFLNEAAGDGFGVGNDLANLLVGNSGANLLIGHGGADSILGGEGNDTLFGMDGDDTIFGEGGIDYIAGGAGDDNIQGYGDADALHGEAGNDSIWGGEGFVTDIMTGGEGDDLLAGDSGLGDYDLMNGGPGNDIYYVDTGDDLTFEAAGGGIDTVFAYLIGPNDGVYLYAHVENLVLAGAAAFGVGNDLGNELRGSTGDNWLLGGGGDDILIGEAGNDVLFGQAGADRFVFAPGSNADVIGDFAPGVDKIDLSAFGFDWTGIQAAMGQNGSDTFINLLNGDLLVLHGVSIAELTATDFLF